jgi:hypothetical protein
MVSWDLRKSAKLQPEPRKPVTTIRQWAGACRVQFGPLHGLASPRKMQGIYREKVLSPSLTYQRSLVSVSDPENRVFYVPELSKLSIFSPTLVLMVVFDDVTVTPACQGWAPQSFQLWDLPLTCRGRCHIIENHHQNQWGTKNRRFR